MRSTSTEDAQNQVYRIRNTIHLNMPTASSKTKRQFSKVLIAVESLRCELDTLNDMKVAEKEKENK